MTRPSPYVGSPNVTTNFGIPQNPYPQVRSIPIGPRKSDAEHQATADRLIAEMLADLDARTAEIVARRNNLRRREN